MLGPINGQRFRVMEFIGNSWPWSEPVQKLLTGIPMVSSRRLYFPHHVNQIVLHTAALFDAAVLLALGEHDDGHDDGNRKENLRNRNKNKRKLLLGCQRSNHYFPHVSYISFIYQQQQDRQSQLHHYFSLMTTVRAISGLVIIITQNQWFVPESQ